MTTGCPTINAKLIILISPQKLVYFLNYAQCKELNQKVAWNIDVSTMYLFLLLRALIDGKAYHRDKLTFLCHMCFTSSILYCQVNPSSTYCSQESRICQGLRHSVISNLST